MDTQSGGSILDTLIGRRAANGELGASPADMGGRIVAAGAHLLFPAVVLLAALLSMLADASGDRVAAFFWLSVLAFLVLVVLSRVAKPRYPMVSYHANQAHWWLLVTFPLLALAAIPAAAVTSATGSDAAGFVLFLPLAAIIAAPFVIAARRVFAVEGHRYPFVAANLEAGRRWREG